VGLGPTPGPQDLLNAGASIFTKFIEVVSLGLSLIGSAGVAGLDRLPI